MAASSLDQWGDDCIGNWDEFTPEYERLRINRSIQFMPDGLGGSIQLSGATALSLLLAVERCSPLSSIINKLASAYANGCVEVLNRNSMKYVRGQYKEWETLMDKPNAYTTKTDFRKQIYAYTKIIGYCYALPEFPAGFTDRPMAIHILHPWMIEVMPAKKTRENLLSGKSRHVFFVYGAVKIELDESTLILFKDTNIEVNRETLLPKSRLLPHIRAAQNVVSVQEAEHSLVEKRGGIGFISSDSGGKDDFGGSPLSPEQKIEMNREFIRANGLTGNRAVVAMTTAYAKWNQMAFNTKDLMLIEIDDSNTGKLADALGYPFFLMSNGKGSTFANVGEAEKSLYQNTIIPDAQAIDEQVNNGLRTSENNILIQTDYSHIEALQQSAQEKATARSTMDTACNIEWLAGAISLNEWRKRNGDDIIGSEDKDASNPVNPYNMRKPQYDKYLLDNNITSLPQTGNNVQGNSNQ